MQLPDYRRIINRLASVPAGQRAQAYRNQVRRLAMPLSAWERQASRALVAVAEANYQTWYHGGLVGRSVGDMILPPSATGAISWKTSDVWAQKNKDRVYITGLAVEAEHFAELSERTGKGGRVYVVAPQGPLSIDPEALRFALLLENDPAMRERHHAGLCGLLSRFTCEAAKVVDMLEVGHA